MKILQITLFITLLSMIRVLANDFDIDTQIRAIHNASPQQRVILMNRLKRNIVQMNQTDRQKAIAKLRQKNSSASMPTQTQTADMHTRVQNHQMNQQLQPNHTELLYKIDSVKTIPLPISPLENKPSTNDIGF